MAHSVISKDAFIPLLILNYKSKFLYNSSVSSFHFMFSSIGPIIYSTAGGGSVGGGIRLHFWTNLLTIAKKHPLMNKPSNNENPIIASFW